VNTDLEVAVPGVLSKLAPVDVAIVLGSGLSGLADAVEDATVVSYSEIDGFPRPDHELAGHAGKLVVGMIGGKKVACFQGRLHCYQGFSAKEAAYTARLASAMGAGVFLATNAAGGISPDLRAGDIVLLSDHVNLMGDNPLVGWAGPKGGFPFVPMRDAYDPELRRIAVEAALEADVPLEPEGVYFALLGPTYETPAEVEMLARLGADIVGMSTVPEVIAARALGMRVLALSLVTNTAAGVGLDHAEVLEIGRVAAQRMEALAIAILHRLP
jgi:purine-nucleoside phosphorylase